MEKDNNQSTPKHVQVENAKKPEKRYIIAHNLNAKEAEVFYTFAKGDIATIGKMLELKAQGATQVQAYQEVEFKITVH